MGHGVSHYVIEPGLSRFSMRAFAGGMPSTTAGNPTIGIRGVTGEARFEPNQSDGAYLKIRLQAASLAVQSDMDARARCEIESAMNHEVFETSRYPEIVFETSNVSASKAGEGRYWVNMVGNLSLHGVTRSQPVAAQVAVVGDTLRAHGEFSLLQTNYDLKPVSVAGGTLKLKNELKFSFDIVARKQDGGS